MDAVSTERIKDQQSDREGKKWKKFPDKSSFIHSRLEYFIDDFKGKRNYSRNRSNLFTAISIISGTVLTIVLGVKATYPAAGEAISVVALPLSAAITGMNSWIAFADHKWKWIRYRATFSTLYTIRDDLRYLESSGREVAEDEIDKIFDQLKRAVHETNQEWMSQRGNALSGMGKGNSEG